MTTIVTVIVNRDVYVLSVTRVLVGHWEKWTVEGHSNPSSWDRKPARNRVAVTKSILGQIVGHFRGTDVDYTDIYDVPHPVCSQVVCAAQSKWYLANTDGKTVMSTLTDLERV
jgi:hypothetical protein